ncbi:MAG: hypothetical protein R2867_29295 [Caldilineaceae bacterium]
MFSLANYKVADFWRKRQATAELTDIHIDPGMSNESVEFVELLQKLREEHRIGSPDALLWGLALTEIAPS